jgi:hypothetical protein
MKTIFVSACLMWLTLVLELAFPRVLPHGSLLLPVACSVMLWTRSTGGLILSGLMLLLDWVARPSTLPLCAMILPFAAAMCVAPSVQDDEYRRPVARIRLPVPLHLPLMTVLALALQTVSSITVAQFQNMSVVAQELNETLLTTAVIAVPVSAIVSLLIRVADEFGVRRSFTL